MDDLSDKIIELTDENGKKEKFKLFDNVEFEDSLYAVVIPVEPTEASSFIVLKLEDSDDLSQENYTVVEDFQTEINVLLAIMDNHVYRYEYDFGNDDDED